MNRCVSMRIMGNLTSSFRWGSSRNIFENFTEMLGRFVPDALRNFVSAQVRLLNEPLALLHAKLDHIFPQVDSHIFLEQIAEIIRTDMVSLRDLVQRQPLLRIVGEHVFLHLFDDQVVLRGQLLVRRVLGRQLPFEISEEKR